MPMRFLACLDGSAESERALPWVRRLADPRDVTLVRIVQVPRMREPYARPFPPTFPGEGFTPEASFEACHEAELYLRRAADTHLPGASVMVRVGHAVEGILIAARHAEADVIALTTHGGSSLGRKLFGGTTENLLHESPLPVLVVSPASADPPATIRRLLVPLDGSEDSELILPLAERLATALHGVVTILHVRESDTDLKHEERAADRADGLEERGLRAAALTTAGPVPETIVSTAAQTRSDLVVMSAHGRGALGRALVGSVALQVLGRSPTPVIVACRRSLRKAQQAEAATPSVSP